MKTEPLDVVLYLPVEEMYPDLYGRPLRANAARKGGWKFVESDALQPFNGVEGFLVRTALIRAEGYEKVSSQPAIVSAESVLKMCGHLRSADLENVVTICLNSQNKLMALHQAAIGGAHAAAFTADTVLRTALLVGARAFILVHNHPGGNPTPSRQDVQITEKLVSAGSCVGITMLDHIIIATDSHVSFLENDLMPSEPK